MRTDSSEGSVKSRHITGAHFLRNMSVGEQHILYIWWTSRDDDHIWCQDTKRWPYSSTMAGSTDTMGQLPPNKAGCANLKTDIKVQSKRRSGGIYMVFLRYPTFTILPSIIRRILILPGRNGDSMVLPHSQRKKTSASSRCISDSQEFSRWLQHRSKQRF